ncbi:Starch-binding associating with outer membrane [Flagellimonas taeanensis]|uniref:RagB/SusD domain-containing protein n=2 Tax=Flagellimonas taeanensis TaxID=1005926 RepID=A0A1M6SE01_9FLAO|nr:Starch-binding associating with outer membrane [Allomuricauda taeanensis]SHK42926.1 RagB/SusD domain-containing protein [Allomuricauda taeanensis]
MRNKNKPSLNMLTIGPVKRWLLMGLFAILVTSCDDFVEIDPPNDQLTGVVVFDDATTVNAALIHIYTGLRDQALVNGGLSGISFLLGLYTDELDLYSTTLPDARQFYDNALLPSNNSVQDLWGNGYNLIHATNAIIEGLEGSTALPQDDRDHFLGEAHLLRAFTHLYLTGLFGELPYLETTDYVANSEAEKEEVHSVFSKVIADLERAKTLLPMNAGSEKVRPDRWTASAILARVHLYNGQWEQAWAEAIDIITNGSYSLNTNLEQVFLNDSPETLWQFSVGSTGANTYEGHTFIFTSGPPPTTALSDHLMGAFEEEDARKVQWIASITDGTDTWYHPNKYRLNTNSGTTQEQSIVIRLAELYLIASEAQAHLGNLYEALNYLNPIRERAGLAPLGMMGQSDLLDAIQQERRVELFTEHGHRFFDLKRTERANSELSDTKPNWEARDMQLPLPESEILLNPNLLPQNEGY